MNAAQAKTLYLPAVIEAAGGELDRAKSNERDFWYRSPFRRERTASLQACIGDRGIWVWTDHGSGQFGNVVAFANVVVGKEPEDRAISEALRWLRGLAGHQTTSTRPASATASRTKTGERAPRFEVVSTKRIHHRSNWRYLDNRAIDREIASEYLREVTFRDREKGKSRYGLGMQNEVGGWEVTTATLTPFKTVVGSKSYTRIQGHQAGGDRAHVFEGMFDFLSFLTLKGHRTPRGDAYILHSTTQAAKVADVLAERLGGYSVRLWLDNDHAGQQATAVMLERLTAGNVEALTANEQYAGYGDLNDWLRAERPRLKLPAVEHADIARPQQKP